MLLKEYIAHHLIGSPLEGVAQMLRNLMSMQERWKYPEMNELYVESERIEEALKRIIQPSMNCIDIGAHLGSMLKTIKQLSPNGRHIAIEPIPYKVRWLKQKFPDVNVLQMAVSDMTGEVDFFLQPYLSGFSGLRPHNPHGSEPVTKVLKVHCNRLDDLVPADLSIGFIKVDVEGGELAALRGGELLLRRCRPTVLFECTQSDLKTHELSPADVYAFFSAHSYGISLVKDWLVGDESLSYEGFVRALQFPFQAFNFLALPR